MSHSFSLPCEVFSDFAKRFLFLSSVFCRSLIGHFQSQPLSSPRLRNLKNIHKNNHSLLSLKYWTWTINLTPTFSDYIKLGINKTQFSVYIHKWMKPSDIPFRNELDLERWTVTSLHKWRIRAIQTKRSAFDLTPGHQRRLCNTLKTNKPLRKTGQEKL